jgi:hypothetical protein
MEDECVASARVRRAPRNGPPGPRCVVSRPTTTKPGSQKDSEGTEGTLLGLHGSGTFQDLGMPLAPLSPIARCRYDTSNGTPTLWRRNATCVVMSRIHERRHNTQDLSTYGQGTLGSTHACLLGQQRAGVSPALSIASFPFRRQPWPKQERSFEPTWLRNVHSRCTNEKSSAPSNANGMPHR